MEKQKWSELEWKATENSAMNGFHVSVFLVTGTVGPGVQQPALRDLHHTLRQGEFLDDLCKRLREARETGAETISCKDLLTFIEANL